MVLMTGFPRFAIIATLRDEQPMEQPTASLIDLIKDATLKDPDLRFDQPPPHRRGDRDKEP